MEESVAQTYKQLYLTGTHLSLYVPHSPNLDPPPETVSWLRVGVKQRDREMREGGEKEEVGRET